YSQPTVGQWTDVHTHPELKGMSVRAGVFAEQLIQSSGEAAHQRRQVLGVDARHVTIPGVLAEGALLPRRTETDGRHGHREQTADVLVDLLHPSAGDRKSTRLNSSHVSISYAVFCLKKKKKYSKK